MNEPSQVLYYEIMLQDLSCPYIELIPLGVAKTQSEAMSLCKMFREALTTSQGRGVNDRNYSSCTVVFKPVIKRAN